MFLILKKKEYSTFNIQFSIPKQPLLFHFRLKLYLLPQFFRLYRLLLIPLAFCLAACPFESTVPLSSGPVEKVDSSLLGYWYGIVRDGSDYFGIEALDIHPLGDSAYRITRLGKAIKGDMIQPDTSFFTGYVCYLDSQRYMNVVSRQIIPPDPRDRKAKEKQITVYYLARLDLLRDTLHIKTVDEGFSTRKQYKNPADLQQQLSQLLKKGQNIYDDLYRMSYRRWPRPAGMPQPGIAGGK